MYSIEHNYVRHGTVFTVCTLHIQRTRVLTLPFPVAGSCPHFASYPPRHSGCYMSLEILIVDDSQAIRRMLRFFIEHNTDWEVCGEAENGQIAVEKVTELKPNVVILDFSMPVMNGLEAAHEIARIAPKVQMIMFTMHVSDQLRRDAQAVGIRDVISKSDTIGGHLIPSLKTTCAGQL